MFGIWYVVRVRVSDMLVSKVQEGVGDHIYLIMMEGSAPSPLPPFIDPLSHA
jgi:hypothetical protein